MKSSVRVASLFLVLIALAHLLRVVLQIPILVGRVVVPMWISILAVVVLGALSTWLWTEGRAESTA